MLDIFGATVIFVEGGAFFGNVPTDNAWFPGEAFFIAGEWDKIEIADDNFDEDDMPPPLVYASEGDHPPPSSLPPVMRRRGGPKEPKMQKLT